MTNIAEFRSITAANGAELMLTTVADGVRIEAMLDDDYSVVNLDEVTHYRLAAHLANHLGLFPDIHVEEVVAWMTAGPDGLYVATPRHTGKTWWGIPATTNRKPRRFSGAEELWPLVRGGRRQRGKTGAYVLYRPGGIGEGELAYYDTATKAVSTREDPGTPGLSSDGGRLYRLELLGLSRNRSGGVPDPLDLTVGEGRMLVRPVGIVMSNSKNSGSVSCVLNEDQYVEILEFLVNSFPTPNWMR